MSDQIERWVLRPTWQRPRKVLGTLEEYRERYWFTDSKGKTYRPRWSDDDALKHRPLWEVFDTEEQALTRLIENATARWRRAQRALDKWRHVEIAATGLLWKLREKREEDGDE